LEFFPRSIYTDQVPRTVLEDACWTSSLHPRDSLWEESCASVWSRSAISGLYAMARPQSSTEACLPAHLANNFRLLSPLAPAFTESKGIVVGEVASMRVSRGLGRKRGLARPPSASTGPLECAIMACEKTDKRALHLSDLFWRIPAVAMHSKKARGKITWRIELMTFGVQKPSAPTSLYGRPCTRGEGALGKSPLH
jgi:hypothetical protein